jgi:hypothetical protein
VTSLGTKSVYQGKFLSQRWTCLEDVRGAGESADSILDKGDILEADI